MRRGQDATPSLQHLNTEQVRIHVLVTTAHRCGQLRYASVSPVLHVLPRYEERDRPRNGIRETCTFSEWVVFCEHVWWSFFVNHAQVGSAFIIRRLRVVCGPGPTTVACERATEEWWAVA